MDLFDTSKEVIKQLPKEADPDGDVSFECIANNNHIEITLYNIPKGKKEEVLKIAKENVEDIIDFASGNFKEHWFDTCFPDVYFSIVVEANQSLDVEMLDVEIVNSEIEEDTLICRKCGSNKVGQFSYSDPNTLEHLEFLDSTTFEKSYYCFNCNEEQEELASYHKSKHLED
jgi:hypothetical protein